MTLFPGVQVSAAHRGLGDADVALDTGLAGRFRHLVGHGHLSPLGQSQDGGTAAREEHPQCAGIQGAANQQGHCRS